MNDSAGRARDTPLATRMLTGRLACLLTGTLAVLFSTQPGVSAAPAYIPDLTLARRSAAGPYSYTGRLLVRDTKGQNLGFVRRNLQDDGTVRADFGNGDTNGDTETAPGISFQIARHFRTESVEYLWLAGVQSTAHNVGDHLAPGSTNFALLSPSKARQDGQSPPTEAESLLNARTDNVGKQETAVWTYSPRSSDPTLSQRITAKWTNPDGTTVDAAIVATGYGLVLTGDAYACAETFGGTEVWLYLS